VKLRVSAIREENTVESDDMTIDYRRTWRASARPFLLLLVLLIATDVFAQQANFPPSSSSGGSSAGPSNGSSVITAGQLLAPITSGGFGAKFDVGVVPDATITNDSNIITCGTDCKFVTGPTPAKVNQVIFGTAGGAGTGCLDNTTITFGGAVQTTILSVDSDTQIHVTGNAAGASAGAVSCLAWGDGARSSYSCQAAKRLFPLRCSTILRDALPQHRRAPAT
jgi:hypothetical protein